MTEPITLPLMHACRVIIAEIVKMPMEQRKDEPYTKVIRIHMFIIIYSVGASNVEESFPSFIIIGIEDAPLIEYLTLTNP